MKRKIALLICLLSLSAFIGSHGMAAVAEFSAGLTLTPANGKAMTGKIFSKGNKIRTEMLVMGYESVTIVRQDKKVSWLLLPAQKQYREIPLRSDPAHPTADMQYDIREIGTGQANGFDCKLIQCTFKNPEYGVVTNWMAGKLNMPVRVQVRKKSGELVSTIDYSNIKVGPQADDHFEIPGGYTKL